jgi:hypothetical protein
MRQVTIYLAVRPVRAVVLVPLYSNLRWQVSVLNALRAQTRFWGGSGGLPLPLTQGFGDSALFWAIAAVQDPDALVLHPGTQAELRELEPEVFAQTEERTRQSVADQGFTGSVADDAVERWQAEATATWDAH